jgi:hypothetical protein
MDKMIRYNCKNVQAFIDGEQLWWWHPATDDAGFLSPAEYHSAQHAYPLLGVKESLCIPPPPVNQWIRHNGKNVQAFIEGDQLWWWHPESRSTGSLSPAEYDSAKLAYYGYKNLPFSV